MLDGPKLYDAKHISGDVIMQSFFSYHLLVELHYSCSYSSDNAFGFCHILIILIQAGGFGLGDDDDEEEEAEDLENVMC